MAEPFSRVLELNAAAAILGPAIYYGQVKIWPQTDRGVWETLDGPTRQGYITRAAELLKTLDPGPQPTRSTYYDVARRLEQASAARVLGCISPREPWGNTE